MSKKKIITPAIFTVLLLLFLISAQAVLMPKYMSKPYEGALTGEYYSSEKNHQVVMIGDCELYENISTMTLWRDFGITSYIRGSAQQLIWQSYYLLEDTLKHEKPDVVIFSVLAMKYNEPQKEEYNRMTIDGMKPSVTKLNAVRASMTDEEKSGSYIFPLLRYHERWKTLSGEDFKYLFKKRAISHNGFMMRCDIKPADWIPDPERLEDYALGENAYKYLDKMTKLCKDNNIKFMLLKAPSLFPPWYDEWDAQMVDYAKKNGLVYLNTLQKIEEIGLDFSVDTYDAGLHLNCQGSEKTAKYLGQVLKDEYNLADNSSDENLKKIWDKKGILYDAQKQAQLKEIEETGAVKTFFAD